MSDFDFTPAVKEAGDNSHKVYLANWETKTLFAEANCVWNGDIQHRVHMAIENLASDAQILALALADALDRIKKLETQLNNQE